MKEQILFIIITLIFIQCKNIVIDEEEKIRGEIVEYYSEMLGLEREPDYKTIFDDVSSEPQHSFMWTLIRDDNIKKYLDIFFDSFGGYNFYFNKSDTFFDGFRVLFDKENRIKQVGFFDNLDRFTGENYYYYDDANEKVKTIIYFKHGNVFCTYNYFMGDDGGIIDFNYYFSPIVHPSVDTFEGPHLSICFDIEVIIDIKKYKYEDFQLFYVFYDTMDKELFDIQAIVDNTKIKDEFLTSTTDGFYRLCRDLYLNNHLVMSFGYRVNKGVSEQDLTRGKLYGPIINKNAIGIEL